MTRHLGNDAHNKAECSTQIQTARCMFSALYTMKRSASVMNWKSVVDIVSANC